MASIKTEFADYPIAKASVKIIPFVSEMLLFFIEYVETEQSVALRLTAGILFVVWLALVAVGKGGFIHLLLLSAISIGFVDAVGAYRGRMTQ